MARRSRKNATRNVFLGIILCISLQEWIPSDRVIVSAKRTASRSSLVASTQLEASDDASQDSEDSDDFHGSDLSSFRNCNDTKLTTLERLRRDLFNRYDKFLPPVEDYRKSVKVAVDMTYRQVLDLDEKSQILKSLIWYRQYWKDEHLTWDPEDYEGIDRLSVPSKSVWRPDIAVYEEVGARDLDPRLPFIRLSSSGDILYAEPTILETSCRVDTAFFPFDSQLCSMTFVSWSQPVTSIDLLARRDSSVIQEESSAFFIDTGEWVLDKFGVKKQIARYDTQSKDGDTVENGKRYIDVPATKETSPEDINGNITDGVYAEVRYSLVIRRNSSLYMQSMLFPSILLTSVALLGFYLPPDSGERVGLQITILLTFMVFLLTVGEMFPASTGPYIGVYFVLSMAQLGVNILMTIIVLHIHFKPCVQNKSSWKSEHAGSLFSSVGGQREPESVIPVRFRRFLQFCNRYVAIADDGVAWMLPITGTKLPPAQKEACKYRSGKLKGKSKLIHDSDPTEQKSKVNEGSEEDTDPDKTKERQENRTEQEKLSFVNEENGYSDVQIRPLKLAEASKRSPDERRRSSDEKSPQSSPKNRRKMETEDELHKMMDSFCLDMKAVVKEGMRKELQDKEDDDAIEESMEKEQEEWKSVARAVDRLFFRLYLWLMVISNITLVGAAVHRHFTMDWDM